MVVQDLVLGDGEVAEVARLLRKRTRGRLHLEIGMLIWINTFDFLTYSAMLFYDCSMLECIVLASVCNKRALEATSRNRKAFISRTHLKMMSIIVEIYENIENGFRYNESSPYLPFGSRFSALSAGGRPPAESSYDSSRGGPGSRGLSAGRDNKGSRTPMSTPGRGSGKTAARMSQEQDREAALSAVRSVYVNKLFLVASFVLPFSSLFHHGKKSVHFLDSALLKNFQKFYTDSPP